MAYSGEGRGCHRRRAARCCWGGGCTARWHAAIFHPTCQFLASSGLHWNGRVEGRAEKTEAALDDVRRLMSCGIAMWAIENPRGCIGSRIRPSDQRVQPHDYGEDASKETHLWLHNLPRLRPTGRKPGRIVQVDDADLFGGGVERWGNQTDSGQNAVPDRKGRWQERSRTYQGIALAMAAQWGPWISDRVNAMGERKGNTCA